MGLGNGREPQDYANLVQFLLILLVLQLGLQRFLLHGQLLHSVLQAWDQIITAGLSSLESNP